MPAAAPGSINAVISCAGSWIGCAATNVLASPGKVVAAGQEAVVVGLDGLGV